MPDEPTVNVLWTVDESGPHRWFKHEDGHWICADFSAPRHVRTWTELLTVFGEVFDIHPDLVVLPRFPWAVVDWSPESEEPEIVDADGTVVALSGKEGHRAAMFAVVAAMNEWARR